MKNLGIVVDEVLHQLPPPGDNGFITERTVVQFECFGVLNLPVGRQLEPAPPFDVHVDTFREVFEYRNAIFKLVQLSYNVALYELFSEKPFGLAILHTFEVLSNFL